MSKLQYDYLNIVALVPAYNEEDTIEKTVLSLVHQLIRVNHIIVILDNCTDKTESIVGRLMFEYPQVKCIATVNNTAKKAGALNWGYSQPECMNADFIVQMDADTRLLPDTILAGIQEFLNPPAMVNPDSNLGGVCARFLPTTPIGKMSWLGKMLWNLQNIEYGFADADRIAMIKEDARVLSGTCCIYRKSVLEKVATLRPMVNGLPQIWDTKSIVEDLTLTHDVRELGYETQCCYGMVNLTHIPESLKAYVQQRLRWYSGTMIELKERGLKHYTWAEILVHVFGLFMILTRLLFYAMVIYIVVNKLSIELNTFSYLVVIFVFSYNLYRWKHVRVNRNWIQRLMVFSLIPLELYGILREILMLRSYYMCIFKKSNSW